MNTAVLTGKRVTVAVRTIAVEQDGSVTDVSEFADCSSTDEDVLKVQSCYSAFDFTLSQLRYSSHKVH